MINCAKWSGVHCSVVQCSAVHCGALQYSALQCSAVNWSTVQCSALCCSAVQCSAVQTSAVQCSVVQCSAVQCSVVQCSAVQCSSLQCGLVEGGRAVISQISTVQIAACLHWALHLSLILCQLPGQLNYISVNINLLDIRAALGPCSWCFLCKILGLATPKITWG